MEVLVFIPGIMGSQLTLPDGERVWPPTPVEVATGYRRIPKLLSTTLQPDGIIEKACIDVYGKLIEMLQDAGYGHAGQQRLIAHPYDWRRDLAALSDELDTLLAALVATHGAGVEIKLVCHSMGGLVARGCLEKPRAAAPSWARAVKLCVFMATPHEGAPLAFARAIGVGGGSLGLSPAQLRQVSGAAGYPAGYQLFPPASVQPIWRLDDPEPFRGLDLFSAEVAGAYPLNPAHLQATLAFQARLDIARKPDGCRYFSIVSAAHETLTRFDEAGGQASPVKVKATGDGTVPIKSAAALPIQTAYVFANHMGVPQKEATHQLLKVLLGVNPPEVIVAGAGEPKQASALSLSERVIAEHEPFEIVVASSGDGLEAEVLITREVAGGQFARAQTIPILVRAQGLERLSLRGPALAAGRYQFILTSGDEALDVEDLVVMHANRDA